MAACGMSEVYAQQTPLNTVCNEKSGLQWDMNLELDVDFYTVHVANNPGIATANPPVPGLITVPHDPANAQIDNNGNKVVTHTMQVTMAEGDKYFAVSVTDKSGNQSVYSNEVGCEYNTTPGAPSIKLIFTKVK
jgi:hypothetical protein